MSESDHRIPALDGIRGIAALLVLLHHAFYIPLTQGDPSGLARLVSEITKGGWLGVDLFFVLSGFLITGILVDHRDDARYYRNFYARRALRIMPLYYLALAVLFFCYQDSGIFVVLGGIYLTNFSSLFGVPMLFGPLWSLSVEEHFYLLWPCLVRWLDRRRMALLAVAIIVLSPLARHMAFGRLDAMEIYFFSWFRFDGLAWGALLALACRSRYSSTRNIRRASLAALITGSIILACGLRAGILSREMYAGTVWLYTSMHMIFAGLTAAALLPGAARLERVPGWRALLWCGKVSYCFYLFHVFCFHAVDFLVLRFDLIPATELSGLGYVTLRAAIGTTAAFIIAALSWRYIESPVLRLKRFFRHEKDLQDRQESLLSELPSRHAA